MTSSIDTFSDLLRRFTPFADLTADELDWLSHQAKPFHCSVGQQLFLADRNPEYFYCVLEGRGRLLHHDPALRRPVTLAYAQPGDLIGWAGLARRSPCEWITAATPLKLIGFQASVFYHLEESSVSFSRWVDSNNSPAELMSVLQPSLHNRPSAFPEEREVLRRIAPHMKLIPARDWSYLWMINLLQWTSHPWPVVLKLTTVFHFLKGIPYAVLVNRNAWTEAFKPPLELADDPSLPSGNDLWSNDRYSELLLPIPDGDRSTVHSQSTSESNFYFQGVKIPCVTGYTQQECTMACLEMLSIYFNAPFRKDVLDRAVSESLKRSKASLEVLGNLSAYMGFVGSISDLPVGQLHRTPFPCFTETSEGLVMIFDISKSVVKVVIPQYGRVTIPLDELVESMVLGLSLSPGALSKKTSLSWFFPQIRKHVEAL